MFLRKILATSLVALTTTACANAQPPAPVVTATPKSVAAVHREVPRLDIRVRGPLSPAQVAEIKAGYTKAFPNSTIFTESAGGGAVIFLVIPK
jgi:hypothetical protein